MRFLRAACCSVILLMTGVSSRACADERAAPLNPDVRILPALLASDGIRTHLVRSPFQPGETKLRVLLPKLKTPQERVPVLYLLPVEPADQTHYGDPLAEILRLKLHERYHIVCVAPTFAQMPWYADHPRDPLIRQESYFLRVVVPGIEREYPVRKNSAGRWLIGFSKGGWGAVSLLLRHPDTFDRAAAWDVPYTLPHPDRYQMSDIFGTQENFDRYRIPLLVASQADQFRRETRLVLLGYNLFQDHQRELHRQLDSLKIPHLHRDGPRREHRWDSGWLPEAISLLAELPPREAPDRKPRVP